MLAAVADILHIFSFFNSIEQTLQKWAWHGQNEDDFDHLMEQNESFPSVFLCFSCLTYLCHNLKYFEFHFFLVFPMVARFCQWLLENPTVNPTFLYQISDPFNFYQANIISFKKSFKVDSGTSYVRKDNENTLRFVT